MNLFNPQFLDEDAKQACRDSLVGHEICDKQRTKMIDWMIEVTASFKCFDRTYYNAMTIID
jgi:hypothetical protein